VEEQKAQEVKVPVSFHNAGSGGAKLNHQPGFKPFKPFKHEH
jgi:hypothetical protein